MEVAAVVVRANAPRVVSAVVVGVDGVGELEGAGGEVGEPIQWWGRKAGFPRSRDQYSS